MTEKLTFRMVSCGAERHANQCEGAYDADGRGLANVDGADWWTVWLSSRVRKRCLTLGRLFPYQLRKLLTCTIALRRTLPSLARWALKPIVCPLLG